MEDAELFIEVSKETHIGEIRKKIVSLILPITIENILQTLAGFISMGMIGRIDEIAVSSLGLSMRITQIVWALFKGITTGAAVFVAQAYGAKDIKKLRKVIQQTLLSSIILVILLQVIIFFNAASLLSIFNPDPLLLRNAELYLKIVSFGLPAVAVMLVVASVLQGMGNAKTPMQIALMMNFFNILFSYILIFGNLGFGPLGIRGAAIAMVLAQFIAAAIGLYVLFNKNGVLGSIYKRDLFKLDMKQITEVYRVGMPTSLESIFWQLSAIVLTRVILSFGNVALASYQLGLQAEALSYMPAMGFAVAASTFIGQSLGAKKPEEAKIYLQETARGSLFITLISVALLVFLPKPIMSLLTDKPEIIDLGAKYLFIMGLVQIPQNMSAVLNGALRGAGITWAPMVVAGAGLWGIRIPLSLFLTYYFKTDITVIWIVMGVDLIFRYGFSYTLYKIKNIYGVKSVLEN
jgi:putative MATE family efflux protein